MKNGLFLDGIWKSGGALPAAALLILITILYASCVKSTNANGLATGDAPAAPVKKTVLVITPYQIDLPVNMISTQAIREVFVDAVDLRLDVYYEYLDLNRFSEPSYQQKIFDLYAYKYKSKQVDLVITITERMLSLWLARRAELLPNTPIVFFDITTEHLDTLKLPSDVTGVSGVLDYTKSAQWILDKLPAVKEIVIVRGVGKADREYIKPVRNLQEKMEGRIKLTDLSSLSLSEIKQRVAALPKSAVVFYALMFEDAAGEKYLPINALRELTAASAVPVIIGYDTLIGTGSIGGYVYSYDHQARDAARISLRILRGEAASAVPVSKDQSDQFIFDHPVLRRFNIPLSVMPPDSIIKNRQYSAWELYRWQIVSVSAVFVILVLLVIFLIMVTRRLGKARVALILLNADLETKVQERTITLRQTNHALELEIIERKLVEDNVKNLLAQKELILKEVHHRIKNNMNTMGSLLSLQAGNMKDQTAIAALKDAKDRMLSMGLLYDKLYRSRDFSELSLNIYLSPLIDEILKNHTGSISVKVNKNIQEIVIDAKRIQWLGIIANELITNTMKYAFLDRRDGVITFSAILSGENVIVSVEDDGKGMPESVDFENSTGFGMTLIQTLAGQLDGNIRIERGIGTKVVLDFKL